MPSGHSFGGVVVRGGPTLTTGIILPDTLDHFFPAEIRRIRISMSKYADWIRKWIAYSGISLTRWCCICCKRWRRIFAPAAAAAAADGRTFPCGGLLPGVALGRSLGLRREEEEEGRHGAPPAPLPTCAAPADRRTTCARPTMTCDTFCISPPTFRFNGIGL